jgi:hypothetical protein
VPNSDALLVLERERSAFLLSVIATKDEQIQTLMDLVKQSNENFDRLRVITEKAIGEN